LKRKIGRSKIAATKKKQIQKCLDSIMAACDTMTTADSYSKEVIKLLCAYEKKVSNKELVSDYVEKSFVVEKTSLTDKDKTTLIPLIQEQEIQLKE
jgi:hypothetical protein